MKYLSTLCCLAVFVVGINSAAIAIAEPEPICWRPGQPCGKVKRAAEAFAEAIAEPIAEPICWRPGQPCGKAKREAAAEAEAAAICWRPGQPCGKAKRAALALAHAVASANPEAEAFFDKLAIREAFPEPEAVAEAEPVDDKLKREAEAICWRPGQPCGKVKRAAEAIASALAEAAPEPICWRPGQPCGKAKRDADAAAEAICWRPGQPCGKAKREANALAVAAAEALASLDNEGNNGKVNGNGNGNGNGKSQKCKKHDCPPPTTTTPPTTTVEPPTTTTTAAPPALTPGYCQWKCQLCIVDENLVVTCHGRDRGICYSDGQACPDTF